jgi:hypothetical protein
MLVVMGFLSNLVTPIDYDSNPGTLEGAPEYFLLFDGVAVEIEAKEPFAELIKAEPCIYEGAQGHVPTTSVERLEISNSGHLFRWQVYHATRKPPMNVSVWRTFSS